MSLISPGVRWLCCGMALLLSAATLPACAQEDASRFGPDDDEKDPAASDAAALGTGRAVKPRLEGPDAQDPEAVPARRPRAEVGPDDPEWNWTFPPEADEEAKEERNRTPNVARQEPALADPEWERRWPGEDEAERAEQDTLGDRERTHPPEGSDDAPRFAAGEGLDLLSEELGLPNPAEETRAEAPKPAEPKKVARKAAPPVSAKRGKKGQEEQNPEERYQALLKEIEEQKSQWAEKRAELEAKAGTDAAKPKEGEAEDDYYRARSVSSARALKAFMDQRPVGVVQARILDAETHQPIPARVRVTDAGDRTAGAQLPDQGFWTEGAFQVAVLAGTVRVEVSAGRFRSSFMKAVEIKAGQTATLQDIVLSRLKAIDEGWYLADLNLSLHARRDERPVWIGEPPGVEDAVRAARAEGVQILGLCLPFSAQGKAEVEALGEYERSSRRDLLVLPVFPGPQHSLCGSALGIGIRSCDEIPLHVNDPHEPLRDWFEELRRQGGLAVFAELAGRRRVDPQRAILPYFPRLKDQFYGAKDTSALLFSPAELPYDTLCGPIYDALAFDGSETALAIWFNLLNEGYSIPIVAAGGGSLEGGRLPAGQTLVHAEGALNHDTVVEACRRGASTVTFGPLVYARILQEEKGPGDRMSADGRPLTLQVRAFASLLPGTQLGRVEILRNGKVVHSEKCSEGLTQLQDFRYPMTEREDAWYVVRVTETAGRAAPVLRAAFTNPIYFDTPGRTFPVPARSRWRGTLRRAGGTPLTGSVTLMEPGKEKEVLQVGADGRFDISISASGTLIFASPGYEPVARRAFDDQRLQRALSALHTEREGTLRDQLSRRATFGLWRLLLLELGSDIELERLKEK